MHGDNGVFILTHLAINMTIRYHATLSHWVNTHHRHSPTGSHVIRHGAPAKRPPAFSLSALGIISLGAVRLLMNPAVLCI